MIVIEEPFELLLNDELGLASAGKLDEVMFPVVTLPVVARLTKRLVTPCATLLVICTNRFTGFNAALAKVEMLNEGVESGIVVAKKDMEVSLAGATGTVVLAGAVRLVARGRTGLLGTTVPLMISPKQKLPTVSREQTALVKGLRMYSVSYEARTTSCWASNSTEQLPAKARRADLTRVSEQR